MGEDLTPRQRTEVSRVFDEAIDRPAHEREAHARTQCGDDEVVLDELLSMLRQARQDVATWDEPASGVARSTADAVPGARAIPEHIGSFSLKSVIASGGMGTVYLAVQDQPHRRVAVKVLRHGIASASALRRFELESQMLARLRHPNVAQVYDAGTHEADGTEVPYFAMEYIPGAKTLTGYADVKGLGTRERLGLFAKVCDAVHHGHQKGIIHRDLKPGNILVDSGGEPKIIDFGVARSTDADVAVTTLRTDIGALIGTLQYMSPEQCAADPYDIDTRSDVYSLGVVLYELLCGRPPYEVSRAALHEATRVIREEPPKRPSSVDRALRGDVETITLKALEKDRDRRYRSAEALADDVRHYLRHEPIQARPPSIAYQLSRFARRHKAVVVGVVAVFLALVLGIVGTTLALMRALRAEDLAGDRLGAVQDALARAESAEDEATQKAEDLNHAVTLQLGDLYDHEREPGGVINTGTLLNVQQRYAESEQLLRQRVPVFETVYGSDHWRTAEARSVHGAALAGLGRYEEAETVLLAAHAGLDEGVPPARRPQKIPASIERLIRLYRDWSRPDRAEDWRARLAAAARPWDHEDINVPRKFAVDVLSDGVPGKTRLEAIRDPEYGSGVLAATVDDGVLRVLRISESSVEEFSRLPGFDVADIVRAIRFDCTGLKGLDGRLYVSVDLEFVGSPDTHIIRVEPDGSAEEVARWGDESDELGFAFDFTDGAGGYVPGAYLQDAAMPDGTSLWRMDARHAGTRLAQDLLPAGRSDLDVTGIEFDRTGAFGFHLHLADCDVNNDNMSVVYKLLPDLTWQVVLGPFDTRTHCFGGLAISPGGALGELMYLTDGVTQAVMTADGDGDMSVFASGFDGVSSLSISDDGDNLFVTDENGIYRIRARADRARE